MAKDYYTRASVFLALVLRHKPESAGITLTPQGWADVSKLLRGMKQAGYPLTPEELEKIVAEDSKQRYSFNEKHTCIRANQGHSVQVDVGLKEAVPPEILWHGTAEKTAGIIRKEGLKAMSRLYVHLSADEETARKVGARHGKPVIFRVKAGEMHRAGYTFRLSENGVWLAESVPPAYLEE